MLAGAGLLVGLTGCVEVRAFDGTLSGTVLGAEPYGGLIRVGTFEQEGRVFDGAGDLVDSEVRVDVDAGTADLITSSPIYVGGDVSIESEFLLADDDWELTYHGERTGEYVVVAWHDANNDLSWSPEEPAWLPQRELTRRDRTETMVLVGVEIVDGDRFYGTAESATRDTEIDDSEASDWVIELPEP